MSWGTKGDNKVSTDLGVVSAGKGLNKNEVEVIVPTAETDIDAAYEDAIHVLSTKPPKEDKKVDPGTHQEDYYKTFRTNVSHAALNRRMVADFLTLVVGVVGLDVEQCLFSSTVNDGFRLLTDPSRAC